MSHVARTHKINIPKQIILSKREGSCLQKNEIGVSSSITAE